MIIFLTSVAYFCERDFYHSHVFFFSQVKGHLVKNHLCVFVNGLVENPAFNSQSKEALTSKETAFGSVPKISDAGLKTLEKSEIVER